MRRHVQSGWTRKQENRPHPVKGWGRLFCLFDGQTCLTGCRVAGMDIRSAVLGAAGAVFVAGGVFVGVAAVNAQSGTAPEPAPTVATSSPAPSPTAAVTPSEAPVPVETTVAPAPPVQEAPVTAQPAETTTVEPAPVAPAPAPAPVQQEPTGPNTTGPGTAAGGPAPVKGLPQQGTYVVTGVPSGGYSQPIAPVAPPSAGK
jgi:hypothetical protein